MRQFYVYAIAAWALVGFTLASLGQAQTAGVEASEGWARASAGAARTGAAYLTLSNRGATSQRLTGASSSAAGRVEIHIAVRDGDVLRMRRVDVLELPPNQTITLRPGALHLMLLDLAAPLKQGARIPLTLTFEDGYSIIVDADIRSLAAAGPRE